MKIASEAERLGAHGERIRARGWTVEEIAVEFRRQGVREEATVDGESCLAVEDVMRVGGILARETRVSIHLARACGCGRGVEVPVSCERDRPDAKTDAALARFVREAWGAAQGDDPDFNAIFRRAVAESGADPRAVVEAIAESVTDDGEREKVPLAIVRSSCFARPESAFRFVDLLDVPIPLAQLRCPRCGTTDEASHGVVMLDGKPVHALPIPRTERRGEPDAGRRPPHGSRP